MLLESCQSGGTWKAQGGGVAVSVQDLTASRVFGVTYTNSSGKILVVNVTSYQTNGYIRGWINGAVVMESGSAGSMCNLSLTVLPGQTYKLDSPWAVSLQNWLEYAWG